MFTKLLATFSAIAFFATAAVADKNEDCEKFFKGYIKPIVIARDQDVPPEVIFQQYLMIGISPEAAQNLITMVYVVHKELGVEEIEEDFYRFCKGETL